MKKLFATVLFLIVVVIVGAIYLYQSNPNSLLPRYNVPFYEVEGFVNFSEQGTIYTQAELDELTPDWWSEEGVEVYGELATVDFTTHFIANNFASGSGCSTEFEPTLVALDEDTLNYNIEVTVIGTCEGGRSKNVSIAIPIEYKDYEIVFTSEVVSTDF